MFLLNSVIYTSDVCCGNHPLGSTQIPQPNLAAPQPCDVDYGTYLETWVETAVNGSQAL